MSNISQTNSTLSVTTMLEKIEKINNDLKGWKSLAEIDDQDEFVFKEISKIENQIMIIEKDLQALDLGVLRDMKKMIIQDIKVYDEWEDHGILDDETKQIRKSQYFQQKILSFLIYQNQLKKQTNNTMFSSLYENFASFENKAVCLEKWIFSNIKNIRNEKKFSKENEKDFMLIIKSEKKIFDHYYDIKEYIESYIENPTIKKDFSILEVINKAIWPIPIYDIEDAYKKMTQYSFQVNKKSIFLLIGPHESGKTEIIKALLRKNTILNFEDNFFEKPSRKIIPFKYLFSDKKLFICDTPGLFDENPLQEIVTMLAITDTICSSCNFKLGIIISQDFLGNRLEKLRKLVEIILKMFPKALDFKTGILLIFTKFKENELEDLSRMLKYLINSEETSDSLREFFEFISSSLLDSKRKNGGGFIFDLKKEHLNYDDTLEKKIMSRENILNHKHLIKKFIPKDCEGLLNKHYERLNQSLTLDIKEKNHSHIEFRLKTLCYLNDLFPNYNIIGQCLLYKQYLIRSEISRNQVYLRNFILNLFTLDSQISETEILTFFKELEDLPKWSELLKFIGRLESKLGISYKLSEKNSLEDLCSLNKLVAHCEENFNKVLNEIIESDLSLWAPSLISKHHQFHLFSKFFF